jgi:hypothetical protein
MQAKCQKAHFLEFLINNREEIKMTIVKREDQKRPNTIQIDLMGPQGNAFYLLGVANDLARKLGLDKNAILEEMKSGDYENLLQVMEKYFGDYIILYR